MNTEGVDVCNSLVSGHGKLFSSLPVATESLGSSGDFSWLQGRAGGNGMGWGGVKYLTTGLFTWTQPDQVSCQVTVQRVGRALRIQTGVQVCKIESFKVCRQWSVISVSKWSVMSTDIDQYSR